MCTQEFGTARLWVPREERTEVIASLRDPLIGISPTADETQVAAGNVIVKHLAVVARIEDYRRAVRVDFDEEER